MNEKKRYSIAISAFSVTIATVIIKLLGFIKQAVIAAVYGATEETDAYFMASGIIGALGIVFFSAIAISLLTLYTQTVINEGEEKGSQLISSTIKVFIPLAILITATFFLFAREISQLLTPTSTEEQLKRVTGYIRILSSYFALSCYNQIINVVLESNKKFFPSKGGPFFQNLFLILASLFFAEMYGIDALVYAFPIAGLAQCIFITIVARKYFRFSFRHNIAWGKIKFLLSISIPLVLGNAVYELNDIVDKRIATELSEGSVSVLSYGSSINEIVTSVIILSLSTVLFSQYSTWVAQGETDKISNNVKNTFECLVVFLLPTTTYFCISGLDIVKLLYGRGGFTEQASSLTSSVVIGYAVGFIFQASRAILIRVFYSFGDTKTPMINGIISVAINIILSVVLSRMIGVGGIAFATSISMCFVTVLLLINIRKHLCNFNLVGCLSEIVKASLSTIISTLVMVIIHRTVQANVLVNLLATFIGPGVIYIMLMFFQKSHTVRNTLCLLRDFIRK